MSLSVKTQVMDIALDIVKSSIQYHEVVLELLKENGKIDQAAALSANIEELKLAQTALENNAGCWH